MASANSDDLKKELFGGIQFFSFGNEGIMKPLAKCQLQPSLEGRLKNLLVFLRSLRCGSCLNHSPYMIHFPPWSIYDNFVAFD